MTHTTQYECPNCQRVTDEWERDGITLRLYCDACGIIVCYPSGRYHKDTESVLNSKRRDDHD